MTTPNAPQHYPCADYPKVGNDLIVAGVPLRRIADTVGSTPFYVYSREVMTKRIQQLRQAMPEALRLHYALKANPMPALVGHLAPQMDGMDVASQGEMIVALNAGMKPGNLSFSGPGKSEAELSAAIAAGIIVDIESERELNEMARIAQRQGLRPKVNLRINPDFELKGAGMKMGGGAKQFGVDVERAPALLNNIAAMGLEFNGLHIFTGSQNLNADKVIECQEQVIDLAFRLNAHAPTPMRHLNIGGGFGVPYFPGDLPLDINKVGAFLAQALPRIQNHIPGVEVILELGRYIVAEAGLYVCRIIDWKISNHQIFLIADGGLHHHLSASGNFGQFIRKNFPVTIGTRPDDGEKEYVNIVGPLCTPLDMLAEKMLLPKADMGDLVVVFRSGAYGLTASPVNFLSHPHAKEILL